MLSPIDALLGFLAARKISRLPGPKRVDICSERANSDYIWFKVDPAENRDYPQSFHFDQGRGLINLTSEYVLESGLVRRRVSEWVAGTPTDKMCGWINGWMANKPADFGLQADEFAIQNGDRELKVTESINSDTWVILVHGRTAQRAETYRAFRIFQELGYSCLSIGLRNNFESTTSAPAISHFGAQECQDVALAVSHARNKGAEKVILYGISMGAISCAEFLRREPEKVQAVILDSPVVDWVASLTEFAKRAGLRDKAMRFAMSCMASKIGSKLIGLEEPVDISSLGFSNWCANFEVPMLIMHSTDDGYIGYEPVAKLASQHLQIIKLSTFEKALHVQLWNYQPERYSREIIEFCSKLSIE